MLNGRLTPPGVSGLRISIVSPWFKPCDSDLPLTIQRIQKELPAWIQTTGNTEKATALMQRLDEHLKVKEFEEAEKTADSILKMMGLSTG